MWIYTTFGQLSVVAHRTKPNTMIVRSREATTISRAHELTQPTKRGKMECTPEADYQHRYECSGEAFQGLLVRLAEDVAYPNFKNACCEQGNATDDYRRHLNRTWWDWEHFTRRTRQDNAEDGGPNDIDADDIAWL